MKPSALSHQPSAKLPVPGSQKLSHKWFWVGHGFQPCRSEPQNTRALAPEGSRSAIYETGSQFPGKSRKYSAANPNMIPDVILSDAGTSRSEVPAESKDPYNLIRPLPGLKESSRIKVLFFLALLAAILSAGASAQDHPVALKGGKVLTVTHGVIDNGVVVMQNGKISAVGAAGSVSIPADAQLIDATGMTIYPGLIDSETHLGLTEISAEATTNDLVEPSDEIMPHMHVYDAFHAETALIPVARLNGITNAVVAPDNDDTLPGQDSFIQLAGGSATEMLLIRDNAMPLNFTGEQRRNKGGFDKRKFPSTRMGLIAQLRQSFQDALDYQARLADYERKKADAARDKKPEPLAPKRDLKSDALLPYLQGRKTIVLAAESPSDLQTAVNLANDFKLKFVLNHISHSQPVLDYVASLKVPVIVGPIYQAPKEAERYDAVYSLPAQLYKRGVKIAFASYSAHNVRNLPDQAGFATAFGLPYDEALKAITINAAEIWGVADKLGSLDVGKTANVVVANGDPLDVKTDVKQVYIEGRAIPMTSRQTWLRDQYSKETH